MPSLQKRQELARMTNLTPKRVYNWFIHQITYDGYNYGEWSKDEHSRYMEAIKIYGKNWDKI